MTKIGSARIDENGNAVGGKAGDQTLREVAIENYYNHPLGWWVLRAKTAATANKLAKAMKAACANEHIGYDQSNRESLYAYAMKVGFDISKVTADCETDCSALVRVCLAYAGIMCGVFNTATMINIIMKTGKFDKLACDPNDLHTGDILVTKKQGHTVIVTSGKKAVSSGSTAPSSDNPPAEKPSSSSGSGTSLSKTVKREGTVTAGLLNVRKWAGKEYPMVSFTLPIPYLTKVGICDTIKAKDGSDWHYIKLNGHFGFVSAKYIK
ncbi:MAG: hypothetical protein IKF99_15560 [Oscillospiraceae bacterium]|nr:hypothetical protein [Oscillospiraceae bacterium]MBR3239839.1 hypothetical protein [Oscillospiraceae bacterium]